MTSRTRSPKKAWLLLIAGLAARTLASTAEPFEELSFLLASSLPEDVRNRVNDNGALEGYVVTAHLNPYYLHGDFDGDGRRDTALLVRHKASGKKGIAVFHSSDSTIRFAGAGTAVGNGGDDFAWMDAWKAQVRGPIQKGTHNTTTPPVLKGDALLVIKAEAASGLVYWTGNEYGWYQRSD